MNPRLVCKIIDLYMHRILVSDKVCILPSLQVKEMKPKVHVSVVKHISKKPYELGSQITEEFVIYGEVITDEALVKAASQRSRQAGYIPKSVVCLSDDL